MMDLNEKREDLWKCISRVDTYISASNFRTALLLTFTFAILASDYHLKLLRLPNAYSEPAEILLTLSLVTLFVSVVLTIFFALRAAHPQTQGKKGSIYYFPGLGEEEDSELKSILNNYLDSDERTDLDNLYQQYVYLSQIANSKFRNHKLAVYWARYGILGSSIFILLVRFKCS